MEWYPKDLHVETRVAAKADPADPSSAFPSIPQYNLLKPVCPSCRATIVTTQLDLTWQNPNQSELNTSQFINMYKYVHNPHVNNAYSTPIFMPVLRCLASGSTSL